MVWIIAVDLESDDRNRTIPVPASVSTVYTPAGSIEGPAWNPKGICTTMLCGPCAQSKAAANKATPRLRISFAVIFILLSRCNFVPGKSPDKKNNDWGYLHPFAEHAFKVGARTGVEPASTACSHSTSLGQPQDFARRSHKNLRQRCRDYATHDRDSCAHQLHFTPTGSMDQQQAQPPR